LTCRQLGGCMRTPDSICDRHRGRTISVLV
jgi:hypothetical protein